MARRGGHTVGSPGTAACGDGCMQGHEVEARVVRVRGQPNDVGLTICSINVDVSLFLAAEAGLIAALIIKGSISCSASQRVQRQPCRASQQLHQQRTQRGANKNNPRWSLVRIKLKLAPTGARGPARVSGVRCLILPLQVAASSLLLAAEAVSSLIAV